MRQEVERDRWATFLEEFTRRNRHRAARLELRGQVGAPLVEDDHPLAHVTVEMEGAGAPHVEVSLGGVPRGARRVSRRLPLVCVVALWTRPDGGDMALEIQNEGGMLAFVSFEPPREQPAA